MKKSFLTESVVIVFLLVAVGTYIAGLGHHLFLTKGNSLAAVYAESLVKLTNKDRDKNELGTLTVNPTLALAAQMKASDMAKNGYFAHFGPDGTAPWDWMKKAGYDYSFAGENLAVNFSDSKDVEHAWMNSPTHRANILNNRYSEIGVATAAGVYKGENVIFVVQMFGEPKTRSLAAINQGAASLPDFFVSAIANPHRTVLTVYAIMFLVISIGILMLIFREYRRHHMRHMIYAIALLVTVVALAWLYAGDITGITIV